MEDVDKMAREREARQGILATITSRNAFGITTLAGLFAVET